MGKRILITGGTGFIGRHLADYLRQQGGYESLARFGRDSWCEYTPKGFLAEASGDNDLTNREKARALFGYFRPTHVYHLAGHNGGIAYNGERPAEIFHDNTQMVLNVLEAARQTSKPRVLSVVTSCGSADFQHYPEDDAGYESLYSWEQGVLREANYLRGRPHPSIACHGYARRNVLLASQFYRQQYGLDAFCVCPTTVYGPGDSFDPQRTKIMGAMVKRFVDAYQLGHDSVTCWGTGLVLREFLFVGDCVRMLARLMDVRPADDLTNLGTGQELSIRKVAETVAACVGYSGAVHWDATRPDGQLRKLLDPTLTRHYFPDFTLTPLEAGISMTVADYTRRTYYASARSEA